MRLREILDAEDTQACLNAASGAGIDWPSWTRAHGVDGPLFKVMAAQTRRQGAGDQYGLSGGGCTPYGPACPRIVHVATKPSKSSIHVSQYQLRILVAKTGSGGYGDSQE